MGGLFNSTILDVIIGMAFVYLLLAIICTSANEWIAGVTKARAKVLKRGIIQLLDSQETSTNNKDDAFLREFYAHPLIKGMMQGDKHPAYLPARTFSAVIIDLATGEKTCTTADELKQSIINMKEGDVKKALQAVTCDAGADLGAARKAIEGWFDDTMDRTTGWYKRKTQVWTLVVAALITLLANADSVQMARRLWSDPVLRSAVVEEAKARAQKPRPSITVEYPNPDEPDKPDVKPSEGDVVTDQERALLGKLIGWQQSDIDGWWKWPTLPQHLLGWLLTVLAVSLGAPFWFDVLNKFMNVRSAGRSPDEVAKKPEKKKLPPEDRAA